MHRVLAVLVCAALLVSTAARADSDPRPLTPRAHRLKVAGLVLLSIAGSASIFGWVSAGRSYYYNTDNHWIGHEDDGPAFGNMAAFTMLAAGIVAGVATPLTCANERQGAVTVRVSPFGVSGTF